MQAMRLACRLIRFKRNKRCELFPHFVLIPCPITRNVQPSRNADCYNTGMKPLRSFPLLTFAAGLTAGGLLALLLMRDEISGHPSGLMSLSAGRELWLLEWLCGLMGGGVLTGVAILLLARGIYLLWFRDRYDP